MRDPATFAEPWTKPRREEHLIMRAAATQALWVALGYGEITLYRGAASEIPFTVRLPASFVPLHRMPQPWHTDGMARRRLSTTVDATLLEDARRLRSGLTDAALVDEALEALLARHRAAEIDGSYAAYDRHPLDEPDAWGDLSSFRRAAAAS